MKTRSDIKDFILGIEKRFPVNDWKYNGIHIWPLIRIRLFFYLIKNNRLIETSATDESIGGDSKIIKQKTSYRKLSLIRKIKSILVFLIYNIIYPIWLNRIPRKDYVFMGHPNHRVPFRGLRFNRFLDSLIEVNNLRNNSLFLEYGHPVDTKRANESIILDNNSGLSYFLQYLKLKKKFKTNKENNFTLEGYKEFIDKLHLNETLKEFVDSYNFFSLNDILNSFYENVLFFETIFRKIKPKYFYVLCYYDPVAMAAVVAANKLKIQSYDIQHGGIGDLHLAYSNWHNAPMTGYDMLPRSFWVWDQNTLHVIEKWSLNNNFHEAVVKGNEWVNYFTNNKENLEIEEGFILYALQPLPNYTDTLFSKQIISTIKHSPYKWLIRLHPRQFMDKEKIIRILADNDILNKTEVELASNLPLPILIRASKVIVTFSSGCAIEAALMNKKTIILNEIGRSYYQGLIEENMAYFIHFKDDQFKSKFFKLVGEL